MIFETKRLILRKPKKSDWKDILEGCKKLEVTKYLSKVPYPYKKKDAEEYINKSLKKWREKEKKNYIFFIELKKKKKVIGITSIGSIDKFSGVGITGSWINKKYWRKGYITEAKIPILDFAFSKLKLRKLETSAYTTNKASNAMSKRLGFKLEGVGRKSVKSLADGKIYDINLYGLFKSEWQKNRGKVIRKLK